VYCGQAGTVELDATELLSHAAQVPVAELTEALELDSQAAHVPVAELADALEEVAGFLGSHAAHVPLELAEALEEVAGFLGSHAAHVSLELAEALEEVAGFLGSHAAHVPVELTEALEEVAGFLPSHADHVLVDSAEELVVSHAFHSFWPLVLYGQLVWVGAHEVMVTSTTSVMVWVLPAWAAATRPAATMA